MPIAREAGCAIRISRFASGAWEGAMEQKGGICMELSRTHRRYLLAIHDLSRGTLRVSSTQIAQALQVSRPSVNRMLGVLAEKELVAKAPYGKVSLTERGEVLARRYQKQVRHLAVQLPALGLELRQEEVYAVASALVEALPDRCFEEECS